MDILTTDARLIPLLPYLVKDANGNEVGLRQLVDTINAGEIARDYLNARPDWTFPVTPREPNAIGPQGQYEGAGVV